MRIHDREKIAQKSRSNPNLSEISLPSITSITPKSNKDNSSVFAKDRAGSDSFRNPLLSRDGLCCVVSQCTTPEFQALYGSRYPVLMEKKTTNKLEGAYIIPFSMGNFKVSYFLSWYFYFVQYTNITILTARNQKKEFFGGISFSTFFPISIQLWIHSSMNTLMCLRMGWFCAIHFTMVLTVCFVHLKLE